MSFSAVDQYAAEVRQGHRFEFGKNWQRFLATLNNDRIALAQRSLQKFLGAERLDGKTFLDVGSGSGLFSLAARRLGATVHSFDYDPQSVACTAELHRRYFLDDCGWVIERGSVLDRDYLAQLGEFDIVYSWGVLHHTGAMWPALENVKPLVRLGGQLYIAIYNDLGDVTDMWRRVKRRYNALPSPLRLPFATAVIAASEQRTLRHCLRHGGLSAYVRTWTEYQRTSTRGMSRWHDWIDWIGGLPYECASIESVVDAFARDGFALTALEDRSAGYGCNEFVFKREAPLGTMIERRLAASRSFARRFGHHIAPPFHLTEEGWIAKLPPVDLQAEDDALLFRGETLVGPAAMAASARDHVVVAPPDQPEPGQSPIMRVATGRIRAVQPPFARRRGRAWSIPAPDLSDLADNVPGREGRSPVYLFEDRRQLGFPHSLHDDIARAGKGRFSHWGEAVYFSTSDGSNPNTNNRAYHLVYRTGDE